MEVEERPDLGRGDEPEEERDEGQRDRDRKHPRMIPTDGVWSTFYTLRSGRRGRPEREKPSGQRLAKRSVAATRARLFGASNALWPESGVTMKSASGQARWSAQALKIGQTTS